MERFIGKAGFLAVLAAGLSGCVVEEPQPEPPGVTGCPRIYEPVCGERFGERETFSNACIADREGYRVLYRGECRQTPLPPAIERPKICPQIYAPVCAVRGGQRRTFDNECTANGNGFRVISTGVCS